MSIRKIDPWLALVCTAALAVTVQQGLVLAHAGNFQRFCATFHRLVSGADIYRLPAGERTGFLYSPTFALLFAPFAVLPLGLGLLVWNGLNALALYWGLKLLLNPRAAHVALAIVFLDMTRSLQSSQSNALVAGLIVLAFVALERDRVVTGAGAIVAGAFIKIYPLGAIALGLIRPRPGRFLAALLVWGVCFAGLPLMVLAPQALVMTYREWWSITQLDTALQGQSVMRLVSAILGRQVPTLSIQFGGMLFLLAPLVARRAHWSDAHFRMRWLSSLLVFCVIFNHQAESPSFVVASTGVAIWYVTNRRSWWRTALVVLVLAFETLPHAFFVPGSVYTQVIGATALDALPCFLVWIVIQCELWSWRGSGDELHVPPPEAVANLA